jgi:alkylated DNA repair dioxygenase AlkB
MEKQIVCSTRHSTCYVVDEWIEAIYADVLFLLAKQLPLEDQPKCKIFGRDCVMHRSIGFFSDGSNGYSYAGQISYASRMPKWLRELTRLINLFLGTDFNGALINYYHNGEEYIGAHSDDESGLSNGVVACISLGVNRIFRIKNKIDKSKIDIETKNGQLLVMDGNFQKEFTHEIPIQKQINSGRISITFRKHTK